MATRKKDAKGTHAVQFESAKWKYRDDQVRRSAFEWPGQIGFAPPEIEKTLHRIDERNTQDSAESYVPER